jgi:hypothetical protein
MQIINLFALLSLQALITTTLAQSALLERHSDDASCLDTHFDTAFCCSDSIADCDDGTFP